MTYAAKLLLLIWSLAGLPSPALSQISDPRESFATAYASYSAGNFAQAKELFQKTLDPNFPLADYSLYYLAVISFNDGNGDLSRQFLFQLRRRYPQSVWFYPAELQRAKVDIAEKKYPQAIETLRALRTEKGAKSEIIDEAIYLQAQAQEAQGDLNQAYSLYQEIRGLSPHSRWTPVARKELARLREKYPDPFGLNTIQAISDEADRLTRERAYADAEILYKKLLNNSFEPAFRLRVLTRLSDLYLSGRKGNEAIPVLQQIVRDYPESSEALKALYQIGRILWNRNENGQALEYFKVIMEQYPNSPYIDRSHYAAGDIYESFGRQEEAIALYSSVPRNFPNSPVRDNAIWRLAWLYHRAGELEQASATFRTLAAQATDPVLRTAALYWQGRNAEKLGNAEIAARLYRQIVDSGEESYYQALAMRALARTGIVIEEPKTNNLPPLAEADPPLNRKSSFHLSRARALAAIALHRMAVAELEEIDRRSRKLSPVRALLMREYFRNQAYDRSLAIANQLPGSVSERNFYRFPLAYWDTIQQKAQERELDPYLVLALIRQESLFDARARSPAAALGLMQILPSTAARVAKQIGLALPVNEKLLEPELNLTLGTQYLKDLLQRYSNNWFKAIAAYNAGETAVDRWEREITTDDIEEFVERIPYLETRLYVKLVMRNHRIYKQMYDPQR